MHSVRALLHFCAPRSMRHGEVPVASFAHARRAEVACSESVAGSAEWRARAKSSPCDESVAAAPLAGALQLRREHLPLALGHCCVPRLLANLAQQTRVRGRLVSAAGSAPARDGGADSTQRLCPGVARRDRRAPPSRDRARLAKLSCRGHRPRAPALGARAAASPSPLPTCAHAAHETSTRDGGRVGRSARCPRFQPPASGGGDGPRWASAGSGEPRHAQCLGPSGRGPRPPGMRRPLPSAGAALPQEDERVRDRASGLPARAGTGPHSRRRHVRGLRIARPPPFLGRAAGLTAVSPSRMPQVRCGRLHTAFRPRIIGCGGGADTRESGGLRPLAPGLRHGVA